MKWKGHKDNELRLRQKFAWFPRRMSNGDVVWLESYYLVEVFSDLQGSFMLSHWYPRVIFSGKDNDTLIEYWENKIRETNRDL